MGCQMQCIVWDSQLETDSGTFLHNLVLCSPHGTGCAKASGVLPCVPCKALLRMHAASLWLSAYLCNCPASHADYRQNVALSSVKGGYDMLGKHALKLILIPISAILIVRCHRIRAPHCFLKLHFKLRALLCMTFDLPLPLPLQMLHVHCRRVLCHSTCSQTLCCRASLQALYTVEHCTICTPTHRSRS